MFAPGRRPNVVLANLPHTYGALLYLAARPDVDSTKIGVMGFSHGGVLSYLCASEAYSQEYTGGKARFAAHMPFYPICWGFLRRIKDPNFPGYGALTKLTGAPVHIQAAGKDDYEEDPKACEKAIDALSPENRTYFTLTFYPNATHGWEGPEKRVFDPMARGGKGGYVNFEPNREVSEKSRALAVEFFRKTLLEETPAK
jgi:dienelactone hydrolase